MTSVHGYAHVAVPSQATSTVPLRDDLTVVVPSSFPQITWELDVKDLIQRMCYQKTSDGPLMVAIAGIPGSGKSTSAEILAGLLGRKCLCMPFDGYHMPMKQLEACRNAVDMIWRRGAPDTFDAEKLKLDLQRIRFGTEPKIPLPGFDHAKGDPELNQHTFFRQQHDIVITEGLYLLHDDDGWSDIKNCFDLTVFVDANVDTCMDRLKIRNQSIPGYTRDEILFRVDAVDSVNAETVARSKRRADLVVKSAMA